MHVFIIHVTTFIRKLSLVFFCFAFGRIENEISDDCVSFCVLAAFSGLWIGSFYYFNLHEHFLTFILPIYFCSENVVCFLRLLHIFKCNSDYF